MLGRLLRPADFESVLATPVRARSAHFAAHHLPGKPRVPVRRSKKADSTKLSTVDPDRCPQPVDDWLDPVADDWWLATVVPKRHARQATTRNLLRRQIRGAMDRHRMRLAPGVWLVRLRAPFDPKGFKSAASDALRSAARAELDGLLMRAAA
jgi:ribonuclease P protein component